MGSPTVSMMKTIILHGSLKKLYDKPIEVEATTVAEALRVLELIPELTPVNGQPWPVTVQGVTSDFSLYCITPLDEIHVYPRAGGAGGKGGLLQVLIGITLIALAIINPFSMLAEGGFLAGIGITQGMVGLTGAMMVLGGLMQMLTPVPENDQGNNNLYLGAGINTVKIGTRIPIVYGTRKIGGHYLSFDVDAKDIALKGDPNEEVEGKRNYFKYDATTPPSSQTSTRPDSTVVSLVPYRAVYSSATPSPTNIPVQA